MTCFVRAAAIAVAGALAAGAQAPLYVFDNGVGRGTLTIEQQAELARRTGYAGLLYSGTKDVARMVAAHRAQGLRVLGIYTGMNLNDDRPGYDPGLEEAIRELKGTGALVTFTVNGKSAGGDEVAVRVIREVAGLAAGAGLKVALYPHYGFHMARVEDALRLREKVARDNVGIVFNLCHWLRSGDAANLDARLRQAIPHTLLVSINGADKEGDWDRLIQPLDRGQFDVRGFVGAVRALGYRGPFGLQCYGVAGDREEILTRSIRAWRTF